MTTTYLFDLDGTIVDAKIYATICPTVLQLIETKTGLKGEVLEKKALQLGLHKKERWDSGDLCNGLGLLEEYYSILEKEVEKSSGLRPEIKDLFQQGKKIGIVSNSMRRTIELYVKRFKLHVDFIFSSEDAGCRKDKVEFWKRLIAKEKSIPKECLVIGDDPMEDGEVPRKLEFRTRLVENL